MKMQIVAKGYGQGIGHFSRFEGDAEVRESAGREDGGGKGGR